MRKVAAVVVTYNRKELLLENIDCLLAQKPNVPDILIVDNHSTDGTAEVLAPYLERGQIRYYDTGSNLGGAGGFQYGIREAVRNGYDDLWIMDDDCMPRADALRALVGAAERLKGNYGFLSSKTLWKDGSLCKMNVQRRSLAQNIRDFSAELIPAILASFVSLFVKAETVREVGLPIKEFFIWVDDWEYTRRISMKYPCFVVTDSVVTHKSALNTGPNIATERSQRMNRYQYMYRNDVYLYRREGVYGFCYGAARLAWHIVRIMCMAEGHKMERIGIVMRGTWRGLFFHPNIEFV